MKTLSYAAHWVAGYILDGVVGDCTFYVEDMLQRDDLKGWDKFPRPFASSEKACAVVLERLKQGSKAKWFVALWSYSTNNIKHAREYCKIKGPDGNPILLSEFVGETYIEIEQPKETS